MKLIQVVLVLASLSFMPALAQTGSEPPSSSSERPPAGPMTQLAPQTENGITYLCAGVGEEEAVAMKQAALDYDLMVTFAASNGAYLAGVNVDIADARGQSLLQIRCDAPIMLVDFEKSGNYRISADSNGHTLTRSAQVQSGGKVRSVAMAWPVKLVDMGPDPVLPTEQSSGSSGDAGTRGSDGSGTTTGTR